MIIDIKAPQGYYITYKSGSGRSVAMGGTFGDRESAQAYLDAKGEECDPPTDFNDIMHVVERMEPE